MNRTNNIIAISCVFVLLSFMNIMNTNRVNSIKLMNIRKSNHVDRVSRINHLKSTTHTKS